MTQISAIQFTQDQARTLTGVSVESVRHWRKTVSYLSAKGGKAARFTFADVIGLAITHEFVNSFGVHVASISVGLDSLFRLLSHISPASLDGAIILITATEATLYENYDKSLDSQLNAPALIVPVGPIMAKIQQFMLPTAAVSSQMALHFLPEVVRNRV